MIRRHGAGAPALAVRFPRAWALAELPSARVALALLLGALVTAALPPIHLLPLVMVAFGGLLWVVERSHNWRGAALAGWAFGFGHFLSGLHWIGHSFMVDAERFGAFAVPALLGLSAFLAIFPAVATALAWLVGRRGLSLVFALAVSWTATEWLRGHVLTGFPWNLVGYVWTASDAPIQFAAVVGAYGLSFVTIIIASLPAVALWHRGRPLALLWPPAAAAALVAGLWAGGSIRLAAAETGVVADVRLRIVQASIPQAMKWDPEERQRIIMRYLDLSQGGDAAGITHIVWPETALPFFVADEPELREAIATVIPEGGLLLTGSPRRTEAADGEVQLWNSLLALDERGEVVAIYDKSHLVPFGEYMPLRGLLPFDKLTAGTIDFSAGPGPMTLSLAGVPSFSPLICYEIIFPGAVAAAPRPRWLLNLTNDAWFGASIGPYQHFAIARVRAIEEGLPLVRAANTGISAAVDGYGRVQARLEINEIGVLDVALPQALPLTPYARLRDLPLIALLVLGLVGSVAARRLPANRKD